MQSLLVCIKDYPEIKVSQSYLDLQKRLGELENMILTVENTSMIPLIYTIPELKFSRI